MDAQSSQTNIAQILFTNSAGTGDFRIGSSGGDAVWQGCGGRNFQIGAYCGMDFLGGRGTATFPTFQGGIGNYNTRIDLFDNPR